MKPILPDLISVASRIVEHTDGESLSEVEFAEAVDELVDEALDLSAEDAERHIGPVEPEALLAQFVGVLALHRLRKVLAGLEERDVA